jgi:cell division protein FtsQ
MAARHDSFAVVSGINPADPPSVRKARMQIYQKFLADLDSTGEHISAHLSEVDLSDPEDVRATVPANGTDLLLHFGDQDFLPRWRNYQAHIAQWEQQYPHLASIDLRYDREVVLKMAGDPGTSTSPGPAASAAPRPVTNPAPKPAAAAPAASHHPAAQPEHQSPAAHNSKTHKPAPAKHHSSRSTPHEKPHASRRSA